MNLRHDLPRLPDGPPWVIGWDDGSLHNIRETWVVTVSDGEELVIYNEATAKAIAALPELVEIMDRWEAIFKEAIDMMTLLEAAIEVHCPSCDDPECGCAYSSLSNAERVRHLMMRELGWPT